MIRALVVSIVLFIPQLVAAQPHFDTRHQQLLMAYHSRFGLPALDGNSARDWTRKLAEQFAFTFPNEGWGHKAGGNGRPPSTDVIARQGSFGFWGYDVILSQGAPSQQLITNPDALNLAGQEYIPVTPTNHLGTSGGGSNPPPVDPTPDLNALKLRVLELEKQVASLQSTVSSLTNDISGLRLKDELLNKQHFELSDYARATDGQLSGRIGIIESKPIPVGCRARFLGSNVGCSLVFQ